ncbi:MAG: hemolysin family protein [Synergistes jonesii]|uniref:hemolysin family protein n=1 Tax=Synergistes jonesii TaxID=2754 RepID=UPI002A76249B|nr:hemolysin family protein [Synergistes jonesii]MDY2983743.1 hemolysin family protein [Synergistes jonesii]
MSSDIAGSIILLAVLMVFSMYFSMTETSITAAGKGKLLAMADDYPQSRNGFLWLADNIAKAINVTLIGNNLVNIGASAAATSVAISLFGAAGPFFAVAVMTVLIVIFCEILPKNIAIAKREGVLLICLPFLRALNFLLTPVTFLLQTILKAIGKIVGMDLVSYSSLISREEIDHIVRESGATGGLEEGERKMIHGVIAFEDTRVSEVMAPRTDMYAIEENDGTEEAVKIFLESGHSRIPVYKEDLDDITGILYAKDLLAPLAHGRDITIGKVMRKPLYVPETMKTDEALDIMKKSRKHLAIVVDEYGGTAGIVTLEDLIEEIVGDIQDEYDKETPEIIKDGRDAYVVQGQVNLEDLAEALNYPFDTIFEDVDTLAGMILEITGNFPSSGQVVKYGPWEIRAINVQNHRILEAKIKYVGEEGGGDGEKQPDGR